MGWAEQVGGASERFQNRLNQFQRKVGLEVFSEVVRRTPVDTGRARGNWQLTLDQPSEAVLGVEDKTGSGAKNKAMQVLRNALLTNDIWISNNLPYISVLEYGRSNGQAGSTQAPQGMVRITVAKWEEFLRRNRDVLGGN